MKTFTQSFLHVFIKNNITQAVVFLMFLFISGLSAQTTYTTTSATTWSAMTWSPVGTPGVNDNVVIAHNVTVNEVVSINNLTVNASRTLTISNHHCTVNGITSISGTIRDNNASGNNIFIGMVTINSGGAWVMTDANTNIEFRGGVTNNGTMTATGTGTYSFTNNNQNIAGNNAITFSGNVSIVGNVKIINNNNNTVRINGTLDGTIAASTWEQGDNATLLYANATEPMSSAGTFITVADNNTVNYGLGAGTQNVKSGTYFNITFSGGGTKEIGNLTILKNFVRTSVTLNITGTQTFSSANDAIYNTGATHTFENIIINKAGSNLTVSSFGFNTQNLTITSGTLVFGSTNTTIGVTNELAGNGTIDMTGATHFLNLSSQNNQIGELITGTNTSTIHYNRSGDQTIFGSVNYFNLQVSGGGTKTLQSGSAVNNQLNMSGNCFLELGNNDLKLRSNATLAGAFSASRYIITNGTGSLWKEFTSIANLTTHIPSGVFPVGSGGFYTRFHLSSITATVFGTAFISVRAVATRQPNVPYFNNALLKHWVIECSNISGINANMGFTFNSAEVMGSVLEYEPRVWNGSSLTTVSNPSAPGTNPFTVTGSNFLTGSWTAIDPTVRTIFYSYQSGDWNNANTWTTDPSGSTLVSPMVPGAGNQVVILNGRSVSTAISRTVAGLTINQGGTVDLGATTGHDFGNISGQGTLRLSTSTLPTGIFTNFVSEDGGTVEFYNLPTGTHTIASSFTTFNNVIISNSTANNFVLNFNHNLTINGFLNMTKTGAANTPIFRIGGASGNRTLNIWGNVNIGAGCRWDVSNPSGNHSINLHGNLVNSGHIEFTNGAAYSNSTNGSASITFRGITTNTAFTGNASSYAKFYGFSIEKNDNFEFAENASSSATVLFHGNGNAINPIGGITRLSSNITVPSLNNNGNYDIGTGSRTPVLWIDGATVTYTSNGAIVPYGTLRITAGTLNCLSGQGAIVLRESGLLQVDGGTINMKLFRITYLGGLHRGAYIQTGGTVNISGESTTEANSYASFSLPYPENVFKMSGGTINIGRSHNGSISEQGGWMVASSPLNYEVTGGTVNVNLSNNSTNFITTATHPFYNLNINKSGAGSAQLVLDEIKWSYNFHVSNTATISGQPLVVLNNLVLTSANSPSLNANDFDVIVGKDYTINSNASYYVGNNTTKFNGTSNQTFSVNGNLFFASAGGPNLVNSPESFSNGPNWVFNGITSTLNVENSPVGTLTGDLLSETNANSEHRFYSPVIPTSGPVTASIFVKPAGRTCVALRVGEHNSSGLAWFSLTGSGSVISTNPQILHSSITQEANGWYRISATTNGHNEYRMRLNLGNESCSAMSYSGNTNMGVYVWGAKVENTDEPTPYQSESNSGINSIDVSKTNGTQLQLAGSITNLNLNGSLNIYSGNFDISNKNVQVKLNVVNNTNVSGSGKIILNGSSNQNIGGNGNGAFNNLELANNRGANGDIKISASAHLRINGSLQMSTNRLFNIANRRLTIAVTGNITAVSGAFSANKFIKTNGNLSDGGIIKEYNASNTSFVFPFGTGTNYTPATIAFNSAPTAWGSLNVRPVAAKQLYVTDPEALEYYWKVIPTGFTGIPANSVNLTFNYGNLPNNTAYIPGYYNFQDIAYTKVNDVNAVNETTKNISFANFSKVDGDFTAGVPDAFGTVIPYYSRQNGNWNSPSTWSNVAFGGAAASTIPNESVPVYIGNGTSIFHTVTVTQNNTLAGSLIVDAGSTLDVGTTIGNNFGALPYATAGGAGRIRISSATATAQFPAGDFGLFFTENGGTTEYYNNGTNFTIPNVTAAPTEMEIETYKNLSFIPETGRSITFPNSNLVIYQNMTINGHPNGSILLNNIAARSIEVRGNLNVTSGKLTFPSTENQSIQMIGNVTVGANGTIETVNSGSALHLLHLMGNLTNNGVINVNNASRCEIVFNGNNSTQYTGTNNSAVNNLSLVRLTKGTNQSQQLNINVLGSFTAPNDSWLTLQNGTLQLSRATNITLTNQASSVFSIPSTAALILNHVDAQVNVGMAASNDADMILAGKLAILNGSFNIGNSANNNHNDLEYSASGNPELIVGGNGNLSVNGQIRRSLFVLLGALKYTQTDNSTVLVRGKNPDNVGAISYDRAKFEIFNQGSEFNMSDNSLLIIDRVGHNSNITLGEFYLNPTSSNVSGGEIRFGTANTSAATFNMTSYIPLWNVTVDGLVNNKTLTINSTPLTVLRNLSILGNSIFNANSLNVTIGGNLINENTTNSNNLNAGGYRVMSPSQITRFNSNTSSQNINGVINNQTVFANLEIANTAGAGAVNLNANTKIRVLGNLSVNQGNFNLFENEATVIGNIINNTQINSTLPGHLNINGTSLQILGGNGNGVYGNVTLNNNAGVNLVVNATINGELNFQSGILYINNHLLTLGTQATIAGTLNATNMIRTNGVLSDGGVRKLYPASAYDFTFPIGVTLKYTPARFNVTSNSIAGAITVKPVNAKHPATTDVDDKELTYYWNVNATGFSPTYTVSHIYDYHPNDALNGNESNYVTGRYFNNVWFPVNGMPGTVNAITDRITLSNVDFINGDITAGEASEFFILQTYFSRNATSGGNWNDVNTWSTDEVLQHAGAAAAVPPSFNHVIIAAGHTVTVSNNNRTASVAEINGTLNLGSTFGHNLGTVSGTGTITIAPNTGNFIFPGGDFSSFTSENGGTINYTSTVLGNIPTQGVYNNIQFTGNGGKVMPNVDILVNGNLTINNNGIVSNPNNRIINLKKNWVNNGGVLRFEPNAGTVRLSGVNQTITGATNFNNLEVNGGGVKTLNSSININNQLNLTEGLVLTNNNELIVQVNGSVSGGSSQCYINGNLRKFIATNTVSKAFEIGDANGYTPVNINFSGSTNGTGSILVNTTANDHPNIYTSGVNPERTVNRIWTLNNSGVSGFSNYSVQLNYLTSDLDPSANPLNLGVARFFSSTWSQPNFGSVTSNSIEATDLTQFGDFQIGELINGIIWTGTVNSNWNLEGNWLPNLIPTANDNIFIGNVTNMPNISTGNNGVCKEVNLDPGTSITIAAGKSLSTFGRWMASNNNIFGTGVVKISSPGVTINGNVIFNGNLEIEPSASLNLASGSDIDIKGNLDAQGLFTVTNRQVTFSGNTNSIISGNPNFYQLNVNKANSNLSVELNGDINVTNRLDMISGDVNLNSFDINLGATGFVSNETANNKIYGSTGRIITERIINAPNNANIAGLGAVLTSGVNLGMTQIIRGHQQKTFNGGFGINRYYEIHPSNDNNLNATFRFYYHDDELNTPLGIITAEELDLFRFDGELWNAQAASLNITEKYLEKSNIPEFSTWSLSSQINHPLPVTLLNFDGKCDDGSVSFHWATASEINNHYFTIEESETGANWYEMHKEDGHGNTNKYISYETQFKPRYNGGSYFRLKQVDFNGETTLYDPIYVTCKNSENLVTILPNPVSDFAKVRINATSSFEMQMNLFSSSGQIIFSRNIQVRQGENEFGLDVSALPVGAYHLQMSTKENVTISGNKTMIKR
jgi:hypothetical protein